MTQATGRLLKYYANPSEHIALIEYPWGKKTCQPVIGKKTPGFEKLEQLKPDAEITIELDEKGEPLKIL